MKPKYQHDCQECEFLGHYNNHDLYSCSNGPTLIARYGDDGPDYKSGLSFVGLDPEITEANRRLSNPTEVE